MLLWNFFTDSPTREGWRVVKRYMDELSESLRRENAGAAAGGAGAGGSDRRVPFVEELREPEQRLLGRGSRPLQFDDAVHRTLCAELKHLYTAITRARVNVWIYERDETVRCVRTRGRMGSGVALPAGAVCTIAAQRSCCARS